jgi:hypothetical protein
MVEGERARHLPSGRSALDETSLRRGDRNAAIGKPQATSRIAPPEPALERREAPIRVAGNDGPAVSCCEPRATKRSGPLPARRAVGMKDQESEIRHTSSERLLPAGSPVSSPHLSLCLRTLSRRRTPAGVTFQMSAVAVLLPESFRGGCSFGAAVLRRRTLPATRKGIAERVRIVNRFDRTTRKTGVRPSGSGVWNSRDDVTR